MTPPAFVAVSVYRDLALKELEYWSVRNAAGFEIARFYGEHAEMNARIVADPNADHYERLRP